MLLLFKRLVLILTAALLAQTSWGFALLGPRDTWQTSALGYDPQGDNGDLGGPKNLGEEWRWNIPEITYGFDESFINYFGTNGMNAIDAAAETFNREMTDFAGISDLTLRRKPTETRRIHETARVLGVMDVKSTAMGMLAEQLGLAGAERWTWALRSRNVPAPNVTNYFVVQRNFDPFTLKPTPYVNNRRWSYQIRSFPAANFATDFEAASTFPVDQSQPISGSVSALVGEDLTTVPNLRLHAGEYFAALTRDDIGGLKYIYSRNNLNIEDVIPGTFSVTLNTNFVQLISGFDLFTFFTNAAFLGPSNLVTLYPGLVISATNVSFTNIVTTNIFLTNLVSSTLFTNLSQLTLITNLDLFTFSEDSRTNPPSILQALYPQLIITATNSTPVLEVVETFAFTNEPWAPVGSPPRLITVRSTNLVANYSYQYANVVTNYASAFTDLVINDIVLAPWSTPLFPVFVTNQSSIRVVMPSGGFYILDRSTNANLAFYALSNQFNVPLLRTTNHIGVTNFSLSVTNFNFFRQIDVLNVFTNVVYAAYPVYLGGIIGEQLVITTNVTPVNRFDLSFDNLLQFPFGSNLFTLQTITFTNGQLVVRTDLVPAPFPTGVGLILDTNQFVLAPGIPPIITSGLATNVLILFTNAATGSFVVQQLIFQTNSAIFAVNPVLLTSAVGPTLRPGVNSLRFRQIRFQDFLNQANATSTNFYTNIITITNGIRSTNIFRRIAGPDILFAADDIGVTTGGTPVALARSLNFQLGATPAPATVDGGPGLIVPGATITFSKNFPFYFNQNPNFMTEDTASVFFTWGSFDDRTITPRLYPEDIQTQITLETLEAFALGRNPPR